MESIMQNNRYLLMPLVAIALVSGCCCTAKNSSLTDAHNSYNSALTDPKITDLAAIEITAAGGLLNEADVALNEGESDDAIDQLAYLAKQQIAIAQETAKQKTAELEIANAIAKHKQIRLVEKNAETEAVKQQLKQLNARKTDRGLMITLDDDLFRAQKAQLKPIGLSNVVKLADILNQYSQYNVSIEGHSINPGFSDRRSYAVRMALIDMGIGGDRIRTHGYADAIPVADTPAVSQLNQWVEIIFSDANGNIYPRFN
jgi:outer membrane protein OmpA-like peptidoglycan-associated protein